MIRPLFFAWALCAVMVSANYAQERRGPGGPGFEGPRGPRNTLVSIAAQPDVQRELALTEDQIAKIGGLLNEQRDQLRESLGNVDFQSLQDLSPEERDQRLAQMRKKADEAAQKSDEKLPRWLNEKQMARLTELRAQRPPDGPGFGPPGFGGPGGPMGGNERKLLEQFDENEDGWLNAAERKLARAQAPPERGPGGRGPGGPGPDGFGPPGGMGRQNREPAKAGPRVSPRDVAPVSGDLYDAGVLRTLFLDFESDDWEAELAAFHNTDVEVPATLTVDGQSYPLVGVHFRGMSSYGMVPAGYKRSLNVSLDLVDSKQRLQGYKTLNLLNAHEDPSLMSTVLYSHIARQYIPAPKANFVKVVINGESWGVYVSAQQFNKEFVEENYHSTKGARWKVSGSPGGGGGLDYLGEDVANYKRRYEIKSADNEKSWRALVKLCKTINQTPTAELEAALAPMLDLDGVLWFLALDVTLGNSDGYWTRASDYSLYLDEKGKFHLIPHDMNEAFRSGGGPGFGGPGGPGGPGFGGPGGRPGFGPREGGPERQRPDQRPDEARPADGRAPESRRPEERGPNGPGPGGPRFGGGVDLDPLVALNDDRKPLRSKLLAVPSLKAKYLANVRTIAQDSLDWEKLGPVVLQYRQLIEREVEADTRKLDSFEAFQRATADNATTPGRGRDTPLRAFVDQRRKYLLGYQEK